MPRGMSPERKALLDELVKDGWPMLEMARTYGISYKTVQRHYPDYRGISKTEQGKMGCAARKLTLALRKNFAQPVRA